MTGYKPVTDGTVKADMTLEQALNALDTALANIGGDIGQAYVKKAGDTMTGNLTISSSATNPTVAVTKTSETGSTQYKGEVFASEVGASFRVGDGQGYFAQMSGAIREGRPYFDFESKSGKATLASIRDGVNDSDAATKGQLDRAVNSLAVVKLETATDGYLASYQLQKDGTPVGAIINIPKDYLVKSGSVKTATINDPSGFAEGTKYIDFVVNTYDTDSGSGKESHIYLNVQDLVDVYTPGDGIEISEANAISVKVVAENGLSVDASGVKMGVASESTNGAMASTMVAKLNDIAEGATQNAITLNGTANANPSFYAPIDAGTQGQVLLSNGSGAPTWSAMPESFHKYTATNKAIAASGGAFSWSIPKTEHGIDSNAIIVQLYEIATGAQVMADVIVDQTTYNVTITIVGTGTLATGTYRVVLFG